MTDTKLTKGGRSLQKKVRDTIRYLDRQQKQDESVDVQIVQGANVMAEYKHLQKKFGDGLSTGYPELDKYFTLIPQQLYLISGQTHIGKTTLCLNIAARVASMGHEVLFCSLEQDIFIAPLVKKIMGEYPKSLDILRTASMASVRTLGECIALMPKKPKLVVLDHLHFLKAKGMGATQDTDENIKELQNLAKGLEIPILVVCHTKKIYEKRAPTMNDLRDSSQLSQVPSVVLLLHREQNKLSEMQQYQSYLSKTGALFIAKNRIQGKTGLESFVLKETGEFVFTKVTNRPSDIPALLNYKDD